MILLIVFLQFFCHCLTLEYKIPVLIFAENDEKYETLRASVTNAFLEVFGTTSYSIGNDSIHAVLVNAGSTENRLEMTQDVVCGQILNSSLATVIYSDSLTSSKTYLRMVSSATYALSFYQLPVVGVNVRDAEFSKKNIYPTFVRPTASLSDEAFVFLHLLLKLQYRQVVVVSIKRDTNSDQFIEEFERRRVEFKIIVQRYIQVELNNNLSTSLAENFEEVTSNIIVLFAKKEDAVKIFANAGDLTGKGKVWIVSESAGEAYNVPNGSLGCRLGQTAISVLRDSLFILRTAIEKIFEDVGKDEDGMGQIMPPAECDRDNVDVEWSRRHAPMILREICGISTSRIHFNERCERIGVEYDILNFNMIQRQVGSMVGSDLQLNESAIEWAGRVKPLEITLPKHLRVVTVEDPPFVYITPSTIGSWYPVLGIPVPSYYQIILSIIAVLAWLSICCQICHCQRFVKYISLVTFNLKQANSSIDTSFSFSLHLNESYGVSHAAETSGRTINGAIGELDTDTADMAIGGLSINPEREKVIDFSEPWLYHGIQILEKNIPKDSPMESFLQPLQSSLWSALFVSVVLVGLAIFCLDFKSPFERFYKADKEMETDLKGFELWTANDVDDNVNFGEAMWFVWGVLLNSGVSEKTPRSCSARVLGIVWCGFCMIIVASYTANLAAFLVLDQPEKGLTGVTDPRLRNPSANFSFGTVLNSNVYQYFKRSIELSSTFRKMEPHNVHKASEAVHRLLNGTLDAFIWDSTRLEFEAARHCELRTRGSLFGRSAYGIGLQKNSPWTPHITSAVLRMSESGVMENLDRKWIESGKETCIIEVHKSPARLGLVNMKDIFILVSCGVILGIIFSFIEVSYGRWLADKGRRRILVQRYFEKWRDLTMDPSKRKNRTKEYNLANPIIRRGFSGIERCTFQELREKRHIRGLPNSRVDPDCFWPDLRFKHQPLVVFCPRCRNIVETDVHRETGLFAILCSLLFATLFLWPCSPLPCFLNSFSDFVHICPLCSHSIGRFRRARSTRFYV